MKILSLNTGLPGYDHGLDLVLKIIHETLSELGVDVVQMNLALMTIPYYDGQRCAVIDNIVKTAESASAVIIGAAVSPYGKGAALEVFAEHLEHPAYAGCISGKNCMPVLTHKGAGIRAALEGYSRMLHRAGANDAVRVTLRGQTGVPPGDEARAYLERQAEEFYRMARANRKFFLPEEYADEAGAYAHAGDAPRLRLLPAAEEVPPARPEDELLKKLGISSVKEEQERDISEITQFFANKLGTAQTPPQVPAPVQTAEVRPRKQNLFAEELQDTAAAAPPRLPTCRQLTQSLVHHFQPQMSAGVAETIQFNISGEEGFSGHIAINGGECAYLEGEAAQPDITILADSEVWKQVVKGKVTAQKAFMVGQLKVRGNFVLLSKFEQLFNTGAQR
ncbi:MAG: SCP2 sterol-binding domain-containing protein [Defluviitaleaceae bacterium]|nr:SCP2 sterol-binding domain-containing protein [Defluviitaleaceae bacterium]